MSNGFEERFQVLHEVIAAARANLDQNIWDYLIGGTATETTVRRNRAALDQIGFRPRVLADVDHVDASAAFLGHSIRLPVALAPVGGLEQIGAGGGATVARGAAVAGIPFFLSSVSEPPMEVVAAAADEAGSGRPGGPRIYQLYVRGDAYWVDDQIARAVATGWDAFCITVDSALYSRRERDIAKRFAKPWRARSPGMEYQAQLNWADIERVRARHAIPLILKGIATAEDAGRACEMGIDGIYVSNHGGRQLDHGAGSMDVLQEVLDAVAGRAFTIVDGGVSRGSDIVKAIAMGADLVSMGRLYCYGLAAGGAEGIARVIELLELEVVECLGLLGVTSFKALDRSHLRRVDSVVEAHVLSAFPLLDLPPYRY